jgi:2-methylcitrate dehydratase PrpD
LTGRQPETGLEAKFNMEYCVATALLHEAPGLSAFTDEAAVRANVGNWPPRNGGRDGPALAYPIEGWARLVVHGRGRHLRRPDTPRGDPKNPMTWDDLANKFRDCAWSILAADSADRAIG